MASTKKNAWIALWISFCLTTQAGIAYIPSQNIIWITDYPPEYPCTLEYIYQIDQVNGWGKIKYIAPFDTYVVQANLYIGTDNLHDTYFQIGDSHHPKITVEMHGNIIIYPDVPRFSSTNEYQTLRRKTTPGTNVLQIGSPADNSITPTIRFAPGCGLAMGFNDKRWPYAGALLLYNTTITSHPTATGRVIGVDGWLRLQGRTIRLINSHIANVKFGIVGIMGGGWDHEVQGTTFENMGIGLLGFWDGPDMKKPIEKCRFLNCDIALNKPSSYVFLKECLFENNRKNWDLANPSFKQLHLKNCVLDSIQTNGIMVSHHEVP